VGGEGVWGWACLRHHRRAEGTGARGCLLGWLAKHGGSGLLGLHATENGSLWLEGGLWLAAKDAPLTAQGSGISSEERCGRLGSAGSQTSQPGGRRAKRTQRLLLGTVVE